MQRRAVVRLHADLVWQLGIMNLKDVSVQRSQSLRAGRAKRHDVIIVFSRSLLLLVALKSGHPIDKSTLLTTASSAEVIILPDCRGCPIQPVQCRQTHHILTRSRDIHDQVLWALTQSRKSSVSQVVVS